MIAGKMAIIRYQGRNEIIDWSAGIKLAKQLIATTKIATAVAPPNFPIELDAVKNTMELISGNNIVAIIAARIGFGLNWKFSPFEKGSENIYTYHIIVNHKCKRIIASRTIFSLEGVKGVYRILANPTAICD